MTNSYRTITIMLSVCVKIFNASSGIVYELKITTPEYTYETSIYNQEVVTSKNNAFSITILNDLPILHKGTLEITPETYYFWLDGRNLQTIEVGAFDNQNITEEIRLESNKLSVISSGTFRNLKIKKIDLSYNEITHIEENAISEMPNLFEVHLSRNKIVKFHDNSFVNTPKVWTFDMTYNELRELGEKWFSFMKKEEAVMIGVGYNKLENVNPKTFDGINVWNLDLSHNQLKHIPEDIFTGSLLLLMLNNNTLKDLPESFFQQKNLTNLDIRDNPLRCDIQQKLKKFSEENSAAVYFDKQNC